VHQHSDVPVVVMIVGEHWRKQLTFELLGTLSQNELGVTNYSDSVFFLIPCEERYYPILRGNYGYGVSLVNNGGHNCLWNPGK